MSLSALWALAAVELGGAEVQINQISSHSLSPGVEELPITSDGQVDPTFITVMAQRPMVSFTSSAIALVLTEIGLSGLAVTGVSTDVVDLWFQKLADGGTRAGGSTSTRFRLTKGMLCPISISASDDGEPATIDVQMAAVSTDGTTAPLAVAVNQALPTPSTDRAFFTVGPVKVNGTQISGVKSIRIDFGLQMEIEKSDGEAYPTFSAIMRRQPRIVVRTKDVNVANTLSGFFAAQGATDSVIYLRKFAPRGTRVANATTEHISFTIDDGLVICREVGGEDGRSQEHEIEIVPIFDGTNDIVAINAATAIA